MWFIQVLIQVHVCNAYMYVACNALVNRFTNLFDFDPRCINWGCIEWHDLTFSPIEAAADFPLDIFLLSQLYCWTTWIVCDVYSQQFAGYEVGGGLAVSFFQRQQPHQGHSYGSVQDCGLLNWGLLRRQTRIGGGHQGWRRGRSGYNFYCGLLDLSTPVLLVIIIVGCLYFFCSPSVSFRTMFAVKLWPQSVRIYSACKPHFVKQNI